MPQLKKKDEFRNKLIEYLSNPNNEFLRRSKYSIEVLGHKNQETVYKHFRPSELTEIERAALDLRKDRMSREIAYAYRALVKQAVNGDVPAIKELFNRLEGKVVERLDVRQQTVVLKVELPWGRSLEKVKSDE